jgi:hypothetical protein
MDTYGMSNLHMNCHIGPDIGGPCRRLAAGRGRLGGRAGSVNARQSVLCEASAAQGAVRAGNRWNPIR